MFLAGANPDFALYISFVVPTPPKNSLEFY
jgi:hypothetical protein